jgi:hypothetical protein
MHTPLLKIGGFVAVVFFYDVNTVVSWVGKVTGMTNRPSGGAAVRWRIPVPLKNVTNTLWVLCSWFKPVIVDANTTPATTLHYKWNPSEVIVMITTRSFALSILYVAHQWSGTKKVAAM